MAADLLFFAATAHTPLLDEDGDLIPEGKREVVVEVHRFATETELDSFVRGALNIRNLLPEDLALDAWTAFVPPTCHEEKTWRGLAGLIPSEATFRAAVEAIDEAKAAIVEEQADGPFFYRTRDDKLLWRPNRSGYTSDPAEAGLYAEPLGESTADHSETLWALPLLRAAVVEGEARQNRLVAQLRRAEAMNRG